VELLHLLIVLNEGLCRPCHTLLACVGIWTCVPSLWQPSCPSHYQVCLISVDSKLCRCLQCRTAALFSSKVFLEGEYAVLVGALLLFGKMTPHQGCHQCLGSTRKTGILASLAWFVGHIPQQKPLSSMLQCG